MRTLSNQTLSEIGHKLYHCERPREYVYYLRFRARCLLHQPTLGRLDCFFSETSLRQALAHWVPEFTEQVTRHFFHKGTSQAERVKIVENHIRMMESLWTEEAIETIYRNRETLTLWEGSFQEMPLTFGLHFDGGEKKEGCLTLALDLNHILLYRIIFWLGCDTHGQLTLHIGALQGPKSDDATTVIHDLTKAYYGYRTKNLIFFALRQVAKALEAKSIVAVSNAGHYTMDRIQSERTLKTNLDSFWTECGGHARTGDPRFFDLPVEESRKDESQIKPNKRSQYRYRFKKLDDLASALQANLSPWLRKPAVPGALD